MTSWKTWERAVASDLGGTRTGPRGYGLPDVQGVEWAVECKEYKKIQLLAKDMEQAADNAKGRPWVLCIKNKPGKGIKAIRVAVIEYETFVNLYRRAYDL